MQNILSLVQTKSSLPLATSTVETMKGESSEASSSGNFFSMLLSQYTEETSSATELAQETTVENNLTNLESSSAEEAKSVDEHLLADLLSVVNALQQDSQTTTFPTLNSSSNLEKILASETARQDFANAKSVSDLLDLSKKYNLGLEKLTISQETVETLQTQFPSLSESNFFDDLQTALSNAQSTSTSTSSSTPASTLMSLLGEQTKTATQEENTSNTSLLSQIFSQDTLDQPVLSSQSTDTDDMQNAFDIIDETLMASTNEETEIITEEPIIVSKEATTKPLESIIQKIASNTNETKKTNTTSSEKTSTIESLTTTHDETETTLAQEDTQIKSEEITKPLKTETSSDTEDIEILQTQVKASHEENDMSENTSDDTSISMDTKSDIKVSKQDFSSKTTSTTSKESLTQFASDLKEQIEAYKPPIMKVELSLSPKSLGDVDVTLLTRGNNLHVNISSNTTTMNLFTQNQDEVKSALVNMGFTNLEMNFSDQRNSEQSQQKQKNNGSGNLDEFSTEQTEEDGTLLEIVIPQYV